MLSGGQSSLSLDSWVNPQSGPWSRNQPDEGKGKVAIGRGTRMQKERQKKPVGAKNLRESSRNSAQ